MKKQLKPLSRETLLAHGKCCGHKCHNCPYTPKHTKGVVQVRHENT